MCVWWTLVNIILVHTSSDVCLDINKSCCTYLKDVTNCVYILSFLTPLYGVFTLI